MMPSTPDQTTHGRDGPPRSDPAASSTTPSAAGSSAGSTHLSRRRVLAALGAGATAGLAGCGGRLPGADPVAVNAAVRTEDTTITWDYPASAPAADGGVDGIGYGSIRFDAVDDGDTTVLAFQLNSTVGHIAPEGPYGGYDADRFRFRLAVPGTYDGASGLRAFVQPPPWPDISTGYGYRDTRRELSVEATGIGEDGTITVSGRFRPVGDRLPRRLYCGFAAQASRPGPLGRSVRVSDREVFDLSTVSSVGGSTG